MIVSPELRDDCACTVVRMVYDYDGAIEDGVMMNVTQERFSKILEKKENIDAGWRAALASFSRSFINYYPDGPMIFHLFKSIRTVYNGMTIS